MAFFKITDREYVYETNDKNYDYKYYVYKISSNVFKVTIIQRSIGTGSGWSWNFIINSKDLQNLFYFFGNVLKDMKND